MSEAIIFDVSLLKMRK